jgi:hypothetical protein
VFPRYLGAPALGAPGYSLEMARGWESKSIEAQQDEASYGRKPKAALSEEERQRNSRRRTIELARAKTAADLNKATAAAHRRMLEQAVQTLDEQLREI